MSPQNLEGNYITPLAILYQNSFDSQSLPNDWRVPHITLVHKKECHNDPSNYTQVGITSVICKVMEVITRDDVMEHLTSNN